MVYFSGCYSVITHVTNLLYCHYWFQLLLLNIPPWNWDLCNHPFHWMRTFSYELGWHDRVLQISFSLLWNSTVTHITSEMAFPNLMSWDAGRLHIQILVTTLPFTIWKFKRCKGWRRTCTVISNEKRLIGKYNIFIKWQDVQRKY